MNWSQIILHYLCAYWATKYTSGGQSIATWFEVLIHWKRPWCRAKFKAGGEGDDRGWDGWMASLTHWTWVWASSGSWWWTWRPGVLQSMGLQRVGHDWVAELNGTELYIIYFYYNKSKIIYKKMLIRQI